MTGLPPPIMGVPKTGVGGEVTTMRSPRVPEPLAIVIFGATGDLTRRKLLPALYRLFEAGLLPNAFAIVGFAREPLSDETFRERMRAAAEEFAATVDPGRWAAFAEHLSYVGAVFEEPEGFRRLAERLAEADRRHGARGNRLYYLAVPPQVMCTVAEQLAGAGLVQQPGRLPWSRIVVEKPFGRDLASAHALNADLRRVFAEAQIYRIDHYLGKETVQNLLVFRFANVVWEPVWNRTYVDHVQITMAETVGVEGRAGYYERSGALRDMVQNHLLQLLTLVAMEPPAAYDAESIRSEKVKVLRSIRPITAREAAESTVRGQYGAGAVGEDAGPAYEDEPGVTTGSRTETFAALRLWIDNWRWAGVPFYLRTGKRLAAKATQVVIRFRAAPHPILDTVEGDVPAPNALVLRIQPEEGISLHFEAKAPGLAGPLLPVSMDFHYHTAFAGAIPGAYERLLLDVMLGDATLFARRDEVEAAWGLLSPVLEAWEGDEGPPLERYAAGSWGTSGSERLLAQQRARWWEP
ncbi:MAG: glucose-6-phosphate dehydrogenase [Gemmatimonadota bacterium]|nr:glucose-6-phosphate dehydrogenase [Gemmatimonadota bacterium]